MDQAGLAAPSGKNEQTTTFVIADDPEIVKAIGGMHSMWAMQQAKAFIACVIDREPLPGRSYYYVRVIQKDEEIAWSSPVWFGAE